jgi:putative flavoprotein involved in K+ transport
MFAVRKPEWQIGRLWNGQGAPASHSRMLRILDRFDACIESRGLEAPEVDPKTRIPIQIAAEALTLDLRRARIRSVVWATGYVRAIPG